MRKYCLVLILIISHTSTEAQPKYYSIQLTNKQGTPFSLNHPAAFLSPRAIERRLKYNIPIDSTDLPCTPIYIENIKTAGTVSILQASNS